MATAIDIGLRELDHRSNDGIDVRLLWDPQAGRVTVVVRDERSDESLELAVEAADALAAFHHPYAYTVDRHQPVTPTQPAAPGQTMRATYLPRNVQIRLSPRNGRPDR